MTRIYNIKIETKPSLLSLPSNHIHGRSKILSTSSVNCEFLHVFHADFMHCYARVTYHLVTAWRIAFRVFCVAASNDITLNIIRLFALDRLN